MADIKVSELNEKTDVGLNDLFPIVDVITSETKKITGTNLLKNQYSTNEIRTNKKWINGKPIYRKTIQISALPSTPGIVSYPTNINDIDQVIDMYGQYQGTVLGAFNTRPINFHTDGAGSQNIATYFGSGNAIKIRVQSDQSNLSGYVTLEYTKTTDV